MNRRKLLKLIVGTPLLIALPIRAEVSELPKSVSRKPPAPSLEVIKTEIAKILMLHGYMINDNVTQRSVVSMCTNLLKQYDIDFKVVCDASNNGPKVVDKNRLISDIYIHRPGRITIESIHAEI